MDDLDHGTLEQLAEATHIVWMDGKLRDGWKYGTITDKTKKIHSCLVPYDQLSEAGKDRTCGTWIRNEDLRVS